MIRAAVFVLSLAWAPVAWSSAPGGDAPEAPTRPVAAPLPFFYDLYSFRGDDGATDVVAAFAVPVGRLKRERDGNGARYRFDVSFILADTAARTVFRSDDSVYVSVPRALTGQHLLYTHVEVAAEPSTSTVQRVIMTDASRPGVGQLYTTPYTIRDFSGDTFMLSDVAMGQPEPRYGWERNDVTLALLPTSQFPGSSFDLYYEIYNVVRGTTLLTEVTVEQVNEAGRTIVGDAGTVRASFSAEAEPDGDGTQAELRRIEASLPKGRYRIVVAVTDVGSGASVRSERFFQVNRPGRDATMVPALPAERGRRGGT